MSKNKLVWIFVLILSFVFGTQLYFVDPYVPQASKSIPSILEIPPEIFAPDSASLREWTRHIESILEIHQDPKASKWGDLFSNRDSNSDSKSKPTSSNLRRWLYQDLNLQFEKNANRLDGILPSLTQKGAAKTCVGTIWLAALYAEEYQIPLEYILLPGHLYMRTQLPQDTAGAYTNFEPNRQGWNYSDEYYQSNYPNTYDYPYYQKSLTELELKAVFLYTVATALQKHASHKEAITLFLKARELFPDYQENQLNLSVSLHALGYSEQARSVLKTMSHPHAIKLLQDLDGEG